MIYGPRQCIGNFDLKLDRGRQCLSAAVPVSSILAGRNCTMTEDEIDALRARYSGDKYDRRFLTPTEMFAMSVVAYYRTDAIERSSRMTSGPLGV